MLGLTHSCCSLEAWDFLAKMPELASWSMRPYPEPRWAVLAQPALRPARLQPPAVWARPHSTGELPAGHESEQEFMSSPGTGEQQGSLVCCSPWGCEELDTTEQLNSNNQQKHNVEVTENETFKESEETQRSVFSTLFQLYIACKIVH